MKPELSSTRTWNDFPDMLQELSASQANAPRPRFPDDRHMRLFETFFVASSNATTQPSLREDNALPGVMSYLERIEKGHLWRPQNESITKGGRRFTLTKAQVRLAQAADGKGNQ